jgi:hypothetical protein
MRTILFVAASAIIPVSELFDGRKRMVLGAEDTTCPNLLKIDGLVRHFIMSQVIRHDNMRNILAFGFLVIQPF